MPRRRETESNSPPLAVDIDGTLIRGDLLFEGVLRLAAVSPARLLFLPFWMLEGRAALKRRVALEAPLPDSSYCLNPDVLEEIESAKADGRDIWLATAADSLAAEPLAARVGAAGVLASDGRVNLAGEAKAEALVRQFGAKGFDYIGDGRRDFPAWRQAREAVGVGLSPGLARRLKKINEGARFHPHSGAGAAALARAMRPHQWVKNLLVFAPLLAHHESSPQIYLAALGLFAALSACASGAYFINDLLDLASDRGHPTKRRRPLASGEISLLAAAAAGMSLAVAGIALGFGISREAGQLLLLYLAGSLAYSLFLKRKLFLDVAALAGLYALRALIGSAISAPLSPWFLAFAIFLFLSLAVVKRQAELRVQEKSDRAGGGREGGGSGSIYSEIDRGALTSIGAASGVAAVVVFTLYLHSPEVSARYERADLLWLLCPLLIYWIGRMTLLANRGAIGSDPVAFALRDRASWIICVACSAVFWAAL